MKLTPLIKPISVQGGTFYTCSSAAEDLQLSLSDSNNKFRFSKFALLKIPPLKSEKLTTESLLTTPQKNYMQINAIPGAYKFYKDKGISPINPSVNEHFAESFQNYFYNLETTITSDPNYDINAKKTVSERVFFKWLKETGAIRFREAKVGKELSGTENAQNSYGIRFVEEDEVQGGYERVVKYVGNINVINSIKNSENAYTEVYMHVPTSHGSTKDVLFASIEDNNYMSGMKFKSNAPGYALEGRDKINTGSNVESHAFFDSEETFDQHWMFDKDAQKWLSPDDEAFKWWYSFPDAYHYMLEENTFSDPKNDIFAIGPEDPNDDSSTDVLKFTRSRLDGISLEFDPNAYYAISSNSDLTSLGDYNASAYAGDKFTFNTILIYYDVYNIDNEEDYSTNLFGILFLDNVDFDKDAGYIESLTKYKASNTLQQNGNAYAFKLNVKFDVTAQDTAVEVTINDYNTYSLQLYADALTEMKKNSTLLIEHIKSYRDLNAKVEELDSIIGDNGLYATLSNEMNSLKTYVENNVTMFDTNKELLKMIEKNAEKINDIFNNKTPIELTYNMDVFEKGSGISIDKTARDKIKIVNENQCFNIGAKPIVTLTSDAHSDKSKYVYETQLREYDNYLRINDKDVLGLGSYFETDRDIVIKINDTTIKWQTGQRFRVSFEYGISLDNTNGPKYTFRIHSGKDADRYTKEIAILTADVFSEHGYKPIIEVICLDADTLEFAVDVF